MADNTPGPPPPAPVRELGYANPRPAGGTTWWDLMEEETTPELQWPACLDVYDRMEATDAQIGSVLRAVSSPITRTPWRVDGTGCRDEVTEHIAEDLGLPIVGRGNEVAAIRTRGRFSWAQHLTEALDAQKYGHQVFEQVYRIDDQGRAHLRKLGLRRGRSIARWNTARDGGLVSIEQRPPANAANGVVYSGGNRDGNITLPVRRLVVYSYDRRGGAWIGRSLLRSVYRNWILKDRLLRVQTQSIERNGMGIPVYTGAEDEKDLSIGRGIAAAIRAGDNAGAAIPHKAELELMGVSGSLADAHKPITYHDEQIARAVLAQFLNLGANNGSGSYALAGVQGDFFTLALQATAEWIRDTATQHIIEDLVDLNWGENEPAPRLVFDEIGSRGDAVVQAVAFLVQSGVLRPDESLEDFIRTQLGLPGYDAANAFQTPQPSQEAS